MMSFSSMSRYLAGALLSLALAGGAVAADGDGYDTIDNPIPAEGLEVVEFFWYGCPHCYRLEPHMEKWLETKPDNVTFRRFPAALTDRWLPHAYAFYVAEELGISDRIHGDLFERIHKQGKLTSNRRTLNKFFAEYGVDGKGFDKTYRSGKVRDKVKKSILYATRIQLQGVPALVVNGKYLVTGKSAGSHEGMIEVVNRLLAEAQAEQAGATEATEAGAEQSDTEDAQQSAP